MSHHMAMLETLKATGHRLTPQREIVLQVVCDAGGHLTADEILTRVRDRYPYLGKSVVYRTLDLLSGLDMITRTDLGQGRIEYELHEHPHHHHLICRDCGSVMQVDSACFDSLARRIKAKYGFHPDLDHFAVFGHCAHCVDHKE